MPISSRFVVQSTVGLLAVGFAALLAIVAMTIWLNERAQVSFNAVIAARDTRSAAVELRNAIQTAESSQRGFLFTGNEIYLAPYDSAKVQATRQLEALKRSLAGLPSAEAILARLSVVVSEKIVEMDRTIALKSALRDDEALTLFRTNRGKALTDEANVFLSGIVQTADERLTEGVSEQRANAAMLRWVSIGGALAIIFVVAGVVVTVARYTSEVRQARDEVRALNTSLEQRVQDRTAALARARDRAEVLLSEVNHRVANSLAMVASLVKLQSNAVTDPAAKTALDETQTRIFAISSVHQRLYSAGDPRSVALDEYFTGLLDHLATSMHAAGHGATLRHDLEAVELPTDASVNLGTVVAEWVTNAFKYAYPDRAGEIRVRLRRTPEGAVEVTVEDDGVGRADSGPAKGTGLGTRIVRAMAANMGATVDYTARSPGTVARIVVPPSAE